MNAERGGSRGGSRGASRERKGVLGGGTTSENDG